MDAKHLIHAYIIPNAGPIATVFAATVAAFVAVIFGTLQWLIARKQAITAAKGVENALKLGQLQLEIAKQQAETAAVSSKTARNKLRFDLFERRILMHDAIMDWMRQVPSQPFDSQHYGDFLRSIKPLKWIFPQHVTDWVFNELSVSARAIAMQKAGMIGNGPGENLAQKMMHLQVLIAEFEQQYQRLHEEFSPYLVLED